MAARFLFGIVMAAAIGLAAAPAPAQLSEGTQFMKAIKERDVAKALALIKQPGSVVVNARDGAGDTALHLMVRDRDLIWVNYLLGQGARPDMQDKNGMTPLALAAQLGWAEGADRLLYGRAKVDLPNNQGETPLILAVHNRDLVMVRLLLSRGADPKRGDTVSGRSALDYAKRDGRSPAMVKLLEEPPVAARKQGPGL